MILPNFGDSSGNYAILVADPVQWQAAAPNQARKAPSKWRMAALTLSLAATALKPEDIRQGRHQPTATASFA